MKSHRTTHDEITCADGFTMSVQANEHAYCTPRVSNAERYTAVEVGFPSHKEELILRWAEDAQEPTETVYGWVPSQTVALVLAKHGGMISGSLPPGIPLLLAMACEAEK